MKDFMTLEDFTNNSVLNYKIEELKEELKEQNLYNGEVQYLFDELDEAISKKVK